MKLRRAAVGPYLFALLAGTLLLLTAAYGLRRPIFLDIGGAYDAPETPGFYAPQQSGDANYRWAPADSQLVFPGLGIGDFRLTLQLSSGRPADGPDLPVIVNVNGHPAGTLNLTPASAAYSLDIPRDWAPDGNLSVAFHTDTFLQQPDRRPLGFLADFARVESKSWPVLPAPGQLLYLAAALAMLYWLALLTGWSRRAAALVAWLVLIGLAGTLAVQPLLLTIFSERIAIVMLMALLGTAALIPALHWLLRRLGYAQGMSETAANRFVGAVATLFALSVIVKVGGLLYPYTFIIDAEFHLKQLQYAIEGRLESQEDLALSVMPADEWVSRAFIPYSPFFYQAGALLGWLPWPTAIWVPAIMAFLDALRVPLVALLALRLGPGPRRALFAALVFAFIPATFLVQQWGNWPTQLSLWLMPAWVVLVVSGWGRKGLRGVLPQGGAAWAYWALSAVALGLALWSYTVTAVYIGIIFGGALVLGLILWKKMRPRLWLVLLQFIPGIAIAVIGFYGQHIVKVITETLPQFTQTMESSGTLTVRDGGFLGFIEAAVIPAFRSYYLERVYLLAAVGVVLAIVVALMGRRARLAGETQRPAWTTWLLLAWLISMPLFLLADYFVDQALKEYWFALPAVAVIGGAWLLDLWKRRGTSRVFAGLFFTLLVWSSISLWVFRLLLHNRG